ncbi:hypothetical protein [Nostoc sp.]|uniref:hypothetical protein n=1 Tax=Nostoc sp. TaxID=1180 RepID=UPI002FF00A0B
MYILCDGNWDRPEIEISDSSQGLIKLGRLFLNISENFKLQATQKKSDFYSENLEGLLVRLSQSKSVEKFDLLKIFIDNKNLVFEGSQSAFYKLGMSLLNYFHENSHKNEHFHLDYVEQDPLLAPTNCSIIFLCTGGMN